MKKQSITILLSLALAITTTVLAFAYADTASTQFPGNSGYGTMEQIS